MADIVKNRKIRPSTRKDSSVNYRVDIKGITASDTLVVNVTHEKKPFAKTFKFKGSDILKKKSLGFKVNDDGKQIVISWISTQPIYG